MLDFGVQIPSLSGAFSQVRPLPGVFSIRQELCRLLPNHCNPMIEYMKKMNKRKIMTLMNPFTDMMRAVIYLRRLGSDFMAFRGLRTLSVRINLKLTDVMCRYVKNNSDIPKITIKKSNAFHALFK
jgi:hypothetical protein